MKPAAVAVLAAIIGAHEALALDLSVRGGAWTSSRQVAGDPAATSLIWARERFDLSDTVTFSGEVIGRAEVERDARTIVRAEVREGFIGYRADTFEIRAGRQLLVWGRSDRIKPTDVASSRDFTLLVPDDDDQKRGVASVQLKTFLDGLDVTAVWMPEVRRHRLAAASAPTVGPKGLVGDHAARIERFGSGFDFSVTYFNGHDRFPTIAASTPGALSATLGRFTMIGADASGQ